MQKTAYDREFDGCGSDFGSIRVDILDPSVMLFKAVGRNANDFNISLSEIFGTTCDFTEFGGANWSEITRVREKDGLGHDE